MPEQEVQAAISEVQESIDKELRVKLDRILLSFLEKICSDETIADNMGNKIHLHFSERHKNSKTFKEGLYIPFRFRIQALVNAFQDEVKRSGILPDDENLPKIIKEYLWSNRFIKRFNEENKKLKIKGNHIWMVEAANTIRGRWIFREYTRKFLTEPPVVAVVGQRFVYGPKIWDPEMSGTHGRRPAAPCLTFGAQTRRSSSRAITCPTGSRGTSMCSPACRTRPPRTAKSRSRRPFSPPARERSFGVRLPPAEWWFANMRLEMSRTLDQTFKLRIQRPGDPEPDHGEPAETEDQLVEEHHLAHHHHHHQLTHPHDQ